MQNGIGARSLPAEYEFVEVVSQPGFGLGALGPVAISIWDGPASREQANLARELVRSLARDHASVLLVAVLGPDVPPPSPAVRQIITEGVSEIADHIKLSVSVVEGAGFLAAAKRSALVGMGMLAPRRWPQAVTSTVDEAACLALAHGVQPARLVEAVERLRIACRMSALKTRTEPQRSGEQACFWPSSLLTPSFTPPPMLTAHIGNLYAVRWAGIDADLIRDTQRAADDFSARVRSMVQLVIIAGETGPADAWADQAFFDEVRRMSARAARAYIVCEFSSAVVRSVQETIARVDAQASVWNVTLAPSVEYVLEREDRMGLGVSPADARAVLMGAGVWAATWSEDVGIAASLGSIPPP